MTSVTKSYATHQLAAFRAVIWAEALAFSLLVWIVILHVIAKLS